MLQILWLFQSIPYRNYAIVIPGNNISTTPETKDNKGLLIYQSCTKSQAHDQLDKD